MTNQNGTNCANIYQVNIRSEVTPRRAVSQSALLANRFVNVPQGREAEKYLFSIHWQGLSWGQGMSCKLYICSKFSLVWTELLKRNHPFR